MASRYPFADILAPVVRRPVSGPAAARRAFVARLAAGVAAIALAAGCLTGLALYQNLLHYRERAETATQNMAQLLEQLLSSAIEKNGVLLYSVRQEYEGQLAAGKVDGAALDAYIAGLFSQATLVSGMGIADETGRLLYGINVVPAARQSIADRDYFIRLRDDPRTGVVVSRPVVGRVSGRWLINLARRLNYPDGSFAGVVYAGVTLAGLSRTFAALDVGKQGVITLRDGDFNLIARYPELPAGAVAGVPDMPAELRELLLAGKSVGTYTGPSLTDRVERTHSYRRIPDSGLYVTVGLSTDDYLATWRSEAAKAAALALLFILGTAFAAWHGYRSWLRRAGAISALAEQEEKFRALVETTSDWIWELDQDCRFTYASPGVRDLLGHEPGELVGTSLFALFPAAEAGRLQARLGSLAGRPFSRLEGTVRHRDGQERVLESSGVPITDALGRCRGYRGISRDVTKRKAREAELSLAASVFNNTMEGVVVTDTAGTIVSVNPAFTEITGYTAAEALGATPRLLHSGRHRPEFYRALWQSLEREGRWSGEIWNRRKDGEIYLEWLTISAVASGDGRPLRYVGLFSDITELRRKDEDIRHLAFHDSLTGLPNRALLLDRLEHGIALARREGSRLAVLFIDLDRFKAINDSLGHDVGDGLLREVAKRLQACVRQADTVARMGGDEFVILLEPAGEAKSCASLADKLIAALAVPMSLAGHAIQIGGSIGVARYPEDGDTVVELMKHADAAMYAAKSEGRNTCRFFQPAMTEKAGQRLRLEMALRQAVPRRELELHYQPQVNLADGSLAGLEALLRWRHPDLGLLMPDDFIPLAEDTGLIVDMGNWVLEEACRQWGQWRAEGLGEVRMAVNLSARQLCHDGLAEGIAGLLRQYGMAPRCLELELTESAAMADPDQAAAVFGSLRRLGVGIAIDDFGTGRSSLAYLRRLPIDTLKIDRSFVMNADRDEEDAQVIRTILALAQGLKLSVVAEGVETGGHAAFLARCGCTVGQGNFYARPAPAPATADWLRDCRQREADLAGWH